MQIACICQSLIRIFSLTFQTDIHVNMFYLKLTSFYLCCYFLFHKCCICRQYLANIRYISSSHLHSLRSVHCSRHLNSLYGQVFRCLQWEISVFPNIVGKFSIRLSYTVRDKPPLWPTWSVLIEWWNILFPWYSSGKEGMYACMCVYALCVLRLCIGLYE